MGNFVGGGNLLGTLQWEEEDRVTEQSTAPPRPPSLYDLTLDVQRERGTCLRASSRLLIGPLDGLRAGLELGRLQLRVQTMCFLLEGSWPLSRPQFLHLPFLASSGLPGPGSSSPLSVRPTGKPRSISTAQTQEGERGGSWASSCGGASAQL